MDMKFGHKKGQAVMEYLITYGLALFVILIVLAILVAVVLPSLQAPETCQFTQPGFGCSTKKHVLVADSGNNVRLLFQLDNEQGKAVSISGVLCSSDSPANINKAAVPALASNISLAGGQSISFGGVGEEVDCVKEDGTDVILAPNSNFKGTLAITYNFDEEVAGAPERLAVATLTGNVQSE